MVTNLGDGVLLNPDHFQTRQAQTTRKHALLRHDRERVVNPGTHFGDFREVELIFPHGLNARSLSRVDHAMCDPKLPCPWEYHHGTRVLLTHRRRLRSEAHMQNAVTPRLVGFLVCSVFYALPSYSPPPLLQRQLLNRYVTARLSQVSGHSVITCTVKDSRGRVVPSQKVSVQTAAATRAVCSLDVKEDKRARPSHLSICTVTISQAPAANTCVRAMRRRGGVSPTTTIKGKKPTAKSDGHSEANSHSDPHAYGDSKTDAYRTPTPTVTPTVTPTPTATPYPTATPTPTPTLTNRRRRRLSQNRRRGDGYFKTDGYPDRHSDTDGDSDPNSHTDSHSEADGHSDPYGHADGHSQADSHP